MEHPHDLLTDQEILTNAGLQNQYTGETFGVDFSPYVVTIPEPSALPLILAGGASGVFRRRRS